MSATICWEPISKSSNHLSVGAPSSFIAMLEEAGIGQVIGTSDLPVIRGMLAAASERGHKRGLQQIYDAVEKHGEIRWWPEY